MPSHIRARKHRANQLATLVTLAFPAAAMAQQAVTLPEVKVEAKAESYKADVSANPKYTQPLVDTPQTIQVIKKEVFLEQGASTLMEALRNTPGLTSQVGENGNSTAGENFTMRGVSSSNNSLFVDGIRDMGAITRDIFNIEQVEVVKGPAGGDIGRGAGAGYINQISKLPSLENANSGTVSINTGNLKRGTIDINRKLDDTNAFRLNAMIQDGGVAGRDYVENTGWALAPSFAAGLGTGTRVFAYAQILRQDNLPDNGIPAIGNAGYRRASVSSGLTGAGAAAQNALFQNGSKVDRDNFYGSVNDYERIDAQQATLKIEHDLAGGGTFRNISRYGKVTTERVGHSPNFIFPTASNAAVPAGGIANPASWTVSLANQGLSQLNEILVNQTSLNKSVTTGSVVHDLAFGLELMSERQRTNTMSATGTVYNNLYNPDPYQSMPMAAKTGAYTDGRTNTVAVYGSDTIKLDPRWQVTGAVRAERYSTKTSFDTAAPLFKDGWLYSWKTGVVFKPATNGSIYAAVANSMTPPGGGNFALSATPSNAQSPNLKPQEALNKEIGTKWDFFEKRFGVTAAYYQTSIKNETPVQTEPGVYTASGDRDVSGVELSAVGAITDKWSISAALATMDTQVKSGTTGDNAAGTAARYSPKLTGTVWSTYNTGVWSAGIGARGSSPQVRVVSGDPAPYSMSELPGYVVLDAMASYQVSKNVTLRLNVYNLTDKYYITSTNGNGQGNSGGRIILGAPRSATLTAAFQF